MKEETLEEAVLRVKSENEHYIDEEAFELGAKWQAERSYSEEEVLDLLNDYHKTAFAYTRASSASPKEWFEQFKKK